MKKFFSIICYMHTHTIKIPGVQPIARSSSEYPLLNTDPWSSCWVGVLHSPTDSTCKCPSWPSCGSIDLKGSLHHSSSFVSFPGQCSPTFKFANKFNESCTGILLLLPFCFQTWNRVDHSASECWGPAQNHHIKLQNIAKTLNFQSCCGTNP